MLKFALPTFCLCTLTCAADRPHPAHGGVACLEGREKRQNRRRRILAAKQLLAESDLLVK